MLRAVCSGNNVVLEIRLTRRADKTRPRPIKKAGRQPGIFFIVFQQALKNLELLIN